MVMQRYTYRAMCADLGHVLLNWSDAEQSLDMCVTIVFKYCGGKKLRNDLPRSLSVKVEFMRRGFRTLDTLAPLATLGLGIMDRMSAVAAKRHDMVHSALAGVESVDGKWCFMKFDYGSDIHTVRSVSFSAQEFRDAGKETMDLAGEVQLLYTRMRKLFLPPRK
jgi:hypothetical protein